MSVFPAVTSCYNSGLPFQVNAMQSRTRPRLAALVLALAAPLLAPAQDLARARQIVGGKCFLCHGMNGESASEAFPRLAGQNATYLAKQLRDFQSGRRKGTAMNDMVGGLAESDLASLGAFFAAQEAQSHPASDAELGAVGRYLYAKGNGFSGVAACASCHGPNAAGTEQLPRLAGQQAPYLEAQLRQFTRRERNNDNAIMHTIASKLTELEIKALAEYLATLP